MEKPKKHHFRYLDPEKSKSVEKVVEKREAREETEIIAGKDLKKVALTFGAFVLLIVAFYFIQNKYDLSSLIEKYLKY